jgi:indole-3-acetate monooxygenase
VEETGEPLIFVLPVDKAELIDNWDVLGLKATGSIDYTIEDVYVPAAFTHSAPTETPVRGGSLFTLGITHIALIGHSAWALGVSRRMLDELCALVRSKAGRPGTMAAHQGFQAIYGEAEARWHAARSFVYETWRGASETISSGATLSVEQKTLLRLALYNATWAAEAISVAVYRAGGTSALRAGVMQRYFRDMHAGTQHITSAPGVIEGCGRYLGGLAPAHDWLYMNLVPKAS